MAGAQHLAQVACSAVGRCLNAVRPASILIFTVLLCSVPARGFIEPPANTQPASLPDEPSQIASSLNGVISDAYGRLVPNAKVILVDQADTMERITGSDEAGHFRFETVAAGVFRIIVVAPGFESFVSAEFPLRAGEAHEIVQVSLRVGKPFDAEVFANQEEIAQQQVIALEKQRVFAIFPNFYTSYTWDAAPLTTRQKFGLATHDVVDSGTFLSAAAVAGVEQAKNIFPGYGQGAQGYAKRFGAATADSAMIRMLGSAVLPSMLHQDPRYFYRGTGTVRSRILYALEMVVMCKEDNGRIQPNYSHIGGSFAAGAISNLYHAPTDRGFGLTMMQSLLDLTGRATNNIIQEFLLRRVTKNAPSSNSGKDPTN